MIRIFALNLQIEVSALECGYPEQFIVVGPKLGLQGQSGRGYDGVGKL